MRNPAAETQLIGARKRRHGRFGALGLFGCLLVVYGVIVLTNPWATHIGGRWTPLLYWTGTGELILKGGTYPLYVSISPSSHFSRLRLDGLRPTGGVRGWGSLCASRGTVIPLELTGTIYGGWRSTEGALMAFRALESQRIVGSSDRGYFNLFGYWHGPQIAMTDRDEWSKTFRSGLKIEHASVTLKWGSKSEFEAACAGAASSAAQSNQSGR